MKIKFLKQCVLTAKTYVLKYNNNNSILQSSTQKSNNFLQLKQIHCNIVGYIHSKHWSQVVKHTIYFTINVKHVIVCYKKTHIDLWICRYHEIFNKMLKRISMLFIILINFYLFLIICWIRNLSVLYGVTTSITKLVS